MTTTLTMTPTLDVSTLPTDGRHVDLALIAQGHKRLLVVGSYSGGRIVFKNASGITLEACAVEINSTHEEDAICFADDVSDFAMTGRWTLNQAVTFWQGTDGVQLRGLTFNDAHTGIRATSQQYSQRNFVVDRCNFYSCKHEGIYLGPSKANPQLAGENITITHCLFREIGWDAIQVGNADTVLISGNDIRGAGITKEKWQDYAITINPGCSGVMVLANIIADSDKLVQVLDSAGFVRQGHENYEDGLLIKTLQGAEIVTTKDNIHLTMDGGRAFIHDNETGWDADED